MYISQVCWLPNCTVLLCILLDKQMRCKIITLKARIEADQAILHSGGAHLVARLCAIHPASAFAWKCCALESPVQLPCLRWRCTRCEIHPNPSGRPSPLKAQHGCMCQSWLVSLGRPSPSVSSRTPIASSRSCSKAQACPILTSNVTAERSICLTER